VVSEVDQTERLEKAAQSIDAIPLKNNAQLHHLHLIVRFVLFVWKLWMTAASTILVAKIIDCIMDV